MDVAVLGEILGAAMDEDTMSRLEDSGTSIKDYEARRKVEPCMRRPPKAKVKAREKARLARAEAAASGAKASGARARATAR